MSAPVILIADDNPTDRFFLEEALKTSCPGATIICVSDGQEAIDYLAGTGKFADRTTYPLPSHIFIDIKMPRRSGFEVLRWLRGTHDVGQTPVTVLSGSQISEDIDQARALGAEYVVKPIGYQDLLEIARAFCRRFMR